MPHDHDHDHDHQSSRRIRAAFALNLGFTLAELVGGVLTNSVAILSDALHDLGDSFALGLAWGLERLSGRQSDARFSFGYRRFSLLAALIGTAVVAAGSVLVLTAAIPRLFAPEPAHALGMLLFAVAGVLINGLAVLRLRGGAGMNARVVSMHLLEDVLGWAAVLVAAIVLQFTEFYILDPILSVAITCYVLASILRQGWRTLVLLLQGVPPDVDLRDLEGRIAALDRVQSVHHTHVWSLDGASHVVSTHVVVAEQTTHEGAFAVKCAVRELLADPGLHSTVEIEYPGEDCPTRDD